MMRAYVFVIVTAIFVVLALDFILHPLGAFAQLFDFTISQEIQTDLGPVFTLANDFNQDGNLDLAVTHNRSNTISILLGNDNGFFSLANNYPVGLSFSIASGDFNRDSQVDLAVALENTSEISLLLGRGDGSFVMGGSTFIPGAAVGGIALISIKSGDFNKDGNLDLVTAGFRQYAAAVLFGDGNGNFSQPQYLIASITGVPTPVRFAGLSAVGIGDFNKDTNLDLAVLNTDESRVFIFLGDGNGLFFTPTNFELDLAGARALSVEDLNKDGNEDVIVSGFNSRINTLFGDGQGNFPNRFVGPLLRGGALSMAIDDFNQDGNLDLALPNFFTGKVDIVAGDDFGKFREEISSFTVSGIPRGATSGDFNKDGFPDLVIANPASGVDKISVLLNNLVRKVNIDIKPDSFPNCINLKSKGLTTVAILGEVNFNVSEINPLSIRFAEATVALKKNGEPYIAFEDVNKDQILDLILHFKTDHLLLSGNENSAILTGNLFNGKAIMGIDSICFRK